MAKVKVIPTHTGPCTCVTSGLSQLVGSRDLVTGGRLGGETMIHVYGQEVPHGKSIILLHTMYQYQEINHYNCILSTKLHEILYAMVFAVCM